MNLYIPSNLNRIKKVKVASLQTMRPSLVKLTALSGISPFTTNVCFDYWLCSTCSVTCTYWLSGIVGQDNIWLESLMTWEPLFAQSILHDQEPIILSCQAQPTWSLYNEQFFFKLNLALSFYIPSSFRWYLPGLLSFLSFQT